MGSTALAYRYRSSSDPFPNKFLAEPSARSIHFAWLIWERCGNRVDLICLVTVTNKRTISRDYPTISWSPCVT